jgi:hypothetical protein
LWDLNTPLHIKKRAMAEVKQDGANPQARVPELAPDARAAAAPAAPSTAPSRYDAWLNSEELNFHGAVPFSDMKITANGRATVWNVHRLALATSGATMLSTILDGDEKCTEFSFAAEYDDATVTAFLACMYAPKYVHAVKWCESYIERHVIPDASPHAHKAYDPAEPRVARSLAALLQLGQMAHQYDSAQLVMVCARILTSTFAVILTAPIADFIVLTRQYATAYIHAWLAGKDLPINTPPSCADWPAIPSAFWALVHDYAIKPDPYETLTTARGFALLYFKLMVDTDIVAYGLGQIVACTRVAQYCESELHQAAVDNCTRDAARGARFAPIVYPNAIGISLSKKMMAEISETPHAVRFMREYTRRIFARIEKK